MSARVLLASLSALLLAASALAADANKPHDHKGVLKPYPATFRPVTLSDAEQAKLQTFKPVFKQTEGETGGRGVAVFLVKASPDVVWKTINSFEKYPKWIDAVDKLEVYKRTPTEVNTYFEISSMGMGVEYFITHKLKPSEKYLTWTLDYTRSSDLDDSVGFWKVEAVDGKPNVAKVTYSVDIRVSGWVPGFIRNLLVDQGLKEATGWVRKNAEKSAG